MQAMTFFCQKPNKAFLEEIFANHYLGLIPNE